MIPLLLLGCSDQAPPADDSAPSDPCEAPFSIEVGSGATAFEPLEEGSPLTMVHGPQGGWHMLGSVRASSTTPNLSVRYTITDDASGVIVSDNTYRLGLVKDGDCSGYYPGMYGYLYVENLVQGEADTPPELLADHPLTLRMEATATDGRSAAAEKGVVAALDERDQADSGS